jgi:site-specific recombinase XerD
MSKITIYQQACNKVAGFEQMGETFLRKLVINGRSKSTHQNYLRQMAKLALHYNRTPLNLEINQLEEYLYFLIQNDSTSLSSFKHLVYGLRKLYVLFDKQKLQLSLPEISRPNKLPVVLSKSEMKVLLKTPDNIRERVLFGLAYDTGMRISELVNLLISDIDLERKQIHIRQSKNKKDRYVTISDHAVRGIKKHLALNSPIDYLFDHIDRKGIPISKTRIRMLLAETVEKAELKKNICVHTFRHTYATHQLEAGQNIMQLKESLGHAVIGTTLVYLKVAKIPSVYSFGCLECLYGK